MLFHRLFPFGRRQPKEPSHTTLHITHAKAGSSWIEQILQKACGRYVEPRGANAAVTLGGESSRYVFQKRRIYPAMLLSRQEVLAHPELRHAKRFIVLRDLRDTLVSLYFSYKVSHGPDKSVGPVRTILEGLSEEDGLLFCVRECIGGVADLQLSWLNCGEALYRYEDLLKDDIRLFAEIFMSMELPTPPDRLEHAVRAMRFETRFGRKLGAEDLTSHGRQGAPGDWKRRFTPAVREAFAERFAPVLVQTGYETDNSWVGRGISVAARDNVA